MIKSIIVLGGGSAGWMSAATLASQFPDIKITVIESPNTPVIGVGESTIGGIKDWMHLLNIKDHQFMKYCDASYKLSIKFNNFYENNDVGFHYPFGQPALKGTKYGTNDWFHIKAFSEDLPVSNFAESFYPQLTLINNNKIDVNNILPGNSFDRDSAYHFDAIKFGKWLKEKYCKDLNVEVISEDITEIEQDEEGIKCLNNKYKADLFIDCTGFKSLLLSKTLKEPFDSYEDLLPNNSAWTCHLPYTNKKEQLVPYTNCTALDNGWVWNIPLWSRMSTGYVYSNKFISDEQALEQFKKYLGRKDLEFKNIKMRVGLHKRLWVKNVIGIGLSAGFIEPLESNGLYTVHRFLLHLVRVLQRKTTSSFDRKTFNASAKSDFEKFSHFVALHYALSKRTDTPYWKYLYDKEWPDLFGFSDIINKKMFIFDHNDTEGITFIATGMNYFPIDMPLLDSYSRTEKVHMHKDVSVMKKNILAKQKIWEGCAKNLPSLYEYLERVIYYAD